MIIPSVDIQNGNAVQLIGGEKKAIDAGDPRPIIEEFGRVDPVAVIDLDAAMGTGSNADVIEDLLPRARCRVGGGIRDVDAAISWLDRGAEQVILGTAATPDILRQLPRERVIAALDARHGNVVVEGWQRETGRDIASRIEELRPFVSGFLVTTVEREGRLQGADLALAETLKQIVGDCSLTLAGGVTTTDEIAALDQLGVDAQVGMALYSGRMKLADAFAAPMQSDRTDGLWATVVVDESERALGLCWSNATSLDAAIRSGRGVYWSRSRGLWEKGATSGATQELIRVEADCDRDALRFVVRQRGSGFCHLDRANCWSSERGLTRLESTMRKRVESPVPGSGTTRCLDDPSLLRAKLIEEAGELAEATSTTDTVHEAADLLYFASIAMARAGVSFSDVEQELDRRSLKIARRPMNAKVKS